MKCQNQRDHYIEINTGTIVLNNIPTRYIMGDSDNLIRRATQAEYDYWHTTLEEFKNTVVLDFNVVEDPEIKGPKSQLKPPEKEIIEVSKLNNKNIVRN